MASTRDSQQQWPLHYVSALATPEFEVCLPVKLHACQDAQQLAFKICQAKTINLSTSTLLAVTNFTSQ